MLKVLAVIRDSAPLTAVDNKAQSTRKHIPGETSILILNSSNLRTTERTVSADVGCHERTETDGSKEAEAHP